MTTLVTRNMWVQDSSNQLKAEGRKTQRPKKGEEGSGFWWLKNSEVKKTRAFRESQNKEEKEERDEQGEGSRQNHQPYVLSETA